MLPISQAAARFGLSRSTLLHYDRIGLLSPTYRTTAGYRLYQEEDLERLGQICLYRKTGLSLERIRELLDTGERKGGIVARALRRRLAELNRQIAGLRRQQQVTLQLLGDAGDSRGRSRVLNKEAWTALMRAAGMNENEMREWHRCFERRSPEAHEDFLESLGLSPREIRKIRHADMKPVIDPTSQGPKQGQTVFR